MTSFISSEKASEITKKYFRITSEAIPLPGDVDENFRIKSDNNEFILKISKHEQDEGILEFQNELLQHLQNKNLSIGLPKPIASTQGNYLTNILLQGKERKVRLLSWVNGRLWARVNPKTAELRRDLGFRSGEITKALLDFKHPLANRSFDWNLADANWTLEHLQRFNGEEQPLLSYFQECFNEIQKTYANLPKSVVHNDINDYNILVNTDLSSPKIQGIIDFGDSVFTQRLNDLAIVITYAIMDAQKPLEAACDVISGYNQNYQLSEKELTCLYALVGMRLVVSVTKSTIRKAEDPTNEYHLISEKPAWNLLKKWFHIHSNFALYSFRAACGFAAHPNFKKFAEWSSNSKVSLKTLFPTLTIDRVKHIDMSVSSTLLGNSSDYNNFEISAFKLKQLRQLHPESILANGYLETRPFYTTNAFKAEGNNGPEYRTVHLGTDFWVEANTPVHAPFNGRVVILHHNNFDKDYGPTLVLEHNFDGDIFYTLYGHLTLSSLSLLSLGQEVKKGDQIAFIGEDHENGNWVPHLHFQITLDLLGNAENFQGVAFPSEKDIWQHLCPNPNLIFSESLDFSEENLSEETIVEFRDKHLGKGLSLSYSKPLHIVRGEGVFLIDIDGKKYLDTANNVNHVGHQHPAVVKAGQEQMAILNTNTRYLHKNIIEYSRKLLKKLPKELSVLHFVNSGSEANELAIRMARAVTKQKDLLAIEVGYHGNTNAVMEVSSYKFDGIGGSGKPETTHILPLPDPFRGKHRGQDSGSVYANYAKKIIDHQKVINEGVAGFIGESMVSCGGQIVPPKNYFKEVYKYVREAGGICIADEVQTGFGRMGKTFWAFQLYDVIPDIVTMGKPAGNGHPLAIVACTPEVANAFATGMEFFNTFGGNPVSCAIGKAVLDVIEEEKLQQNALEVGGFLKSELEQLKAKFPIIGDVRGEGLFLGFELTTMDKKPLANHAAYLANRMKDLGILMSTDGPDHNVLKIKPPMVFSVENAKELIFRLKTVFSEDLMLNY
tara:strand:+ start:10449 stop:13463 length:3015 start_codon:yes stop_codon:yes gene_type:complete